MNVTFLVPPPLDGNPPPERVFGCNYGLYPWPNIFILQPAAVLEEEGHDVGFVDAPIEKWDEGDLDEFLRGDNSHLFRFT